MEWDSHTGEAIINRFDSIVANSDKHCAEEKMLRDEVLAVHTEMNVLNEETDIAMNNLIDLKDDVINDRTEIATTLRRLIYHTL